MFHQSVPSGVDDEESKRCLEYELSCWVDGMTRDTLSEFCISLRESAELSFRSEILLAKAWEKLSLPSPVPALSVSPLLIHVLERLPRASPMFRLLACQVATKCLFHHLNPLPLAVVVIHAGHIDEPQLQCSVHSRLLQYAQSLVEFDRFSDTVRLGFIRSLLSSSLSTESCQGLFIGLPNSRKASSTCDAVGLLAYEDSEVMVRQLLHVMTVVDDEDIRRSCVKAVGRMIAAVFQVRCD